MFDVRDSSLDVVGETLKDNPRGVNVVFDCVGDQTTFDQSLAVVRRGGTIMNVAAWKREPTINMTLLLLKEVSIISMSSPLTLQIRFLIA